MGFGRVCFGGVCFYQLADFVGVSFCIADCGSALLLSVQKHILRFPLGVVQFLHHPGAVPFYRLNGGPQGGDLGLGVCLVLGNGGGQLSEVGRSVKVSDGLRHHAAAGCVQPGVGDV